MAARFKFKWIYDKIPDAKHSRIRLIITLTFICYNTDMLFSKKDKWKNGKSHEIQFWRSCFSTQGLQWPDEFKARIDPNTRLEGFITNYIPSDKTEISILDVGAGPLTSLGKILDRYKINITAVDPLAPEYDNLLKEFNLTPPIRTVFGEAENLRKYFKSKTFDLVHIRNALDHSYNPLKGISEMLRVVKVQGFVLLSHMRNEGEKEKYQGFHQWNLDINDDEFIIWNSEHRFNVNHLFNKSALIEIVSVTDWINIALKKLR